MDGLIMAGQLLLALSILVGLHELGHLLAAKAFGMRVEKYSIGFPPKIWGKKWGETEYSIGAIPLGGFVKISGMIDESLDTAAMSSDPQPWEFRSKPAWQRLIVMMGGIIVNVITGLIIFIFLTYSQGETYISKDELNKHGIIAYPLAEEIGLRTGDRIIDINGKTYTKLQDLRSGDVILAKDGYFTVDRGGEILKITIPNDIIDRLSDQKNQNAFISVRQPFIVADVVDGGLAEQGGIMDGDKIIRVNNIPILYFDEFSSILDSLKGQQIMVDVERGNTIQSLSVQVSEEGKLGIQIKTLVDLSSIDYTFGQAIPKGTSQAFGVVWLNIRAFGKMFSGDVDPRKSLSGPIGIAKFFGAEWDWINFWYVTGLLSMVLAFMNFLPIPALDGGHVMFLTWEIVTRRKPSDKFLENAQKVGMVILLSLMVFVIFNDIIKLF